MNMETDQEPTDEPLEISLEIKNDPTDDPLETLLETNQDPAYYDPLGTSLEMIQDPVDEPLDTIIKKNQVSKDDPLETLLWNILHKCKIEADRNQLKFPLKNFVERVSYYTDVSSVKLQEILSKKQFEDIFDMKPVDIDIQIQILKYLTKFYLQNELPTHTLLYDNLKYDIEVRDSEEFMLKLSLFGIRYRTISNSTFLMEDADCVYERYIYLDKIRKSRAKNAHIYYVDERLIDKSLTLKKPWQESISMSPEALEYVLFYAVSKTGYKNGLFCNNANSENYHKWVVDILLRQIEPSSVIVFNNSPLHGTLKAKSISMYDTKQEMISCLQKHNVPCSRKLNKTQLYDLIKKFVIQEETSLLDQRIKANGHEVLRLPTNFPYLSPVYPIWKELRKSLETPLLDPLMFEIKDEVHAQLMAMPKEMFSVVDQIIVEKENKIFELHLDLEKAQDRFISNIKSNIKIE